MSNYIRTKDGKIYCFIDTHIVGDTIIGYINDNDKNTLDGGTYLEKENVTAQADTIEELVDMWVAKRYVMDEPCHWVYISKDQMKKDISLSNKAYTIYGSIWVDGNLIKVAKMNDKGELELL